MSTYAEFKQRYASMSTEHLLRIAATGDLVPDAKLAMKSELSARRMEIERENYVVEIPPPPPEPPKFVGLWLHIGLAGLSAVAGLVSLGWKVVLSWLQ